MERSSPEALPEGTVLLRGFLDSGEERRLAARVAELARLLPPLVPLVRGRQPMRLSMLCLGAHWDARTYRYEAARTDGDGAPVAPVPDDLSALARRAAAAASMAMRPDVCLVNFYREDGRLGLHQDRDEDPATLARGVPIVSLSLGDDARFRLGGLARRDPALTLVLRSGDALVMGGPSRLRYHGVSRVLPGTGPAGLEITGRVNLTFRQLRP